MNAKKRITLASLSILCVAVLAFILYKTFKHPELLDASGPYLGQSPPGIQAELFAPGIIPRDLHSVAVFAPDGTRVYWKEMDPTSKHLSFSTLIDDRWTVPRAVSLGSAFFDADAPCFSADGQKLFFTSWRPVKWVRPLPNKERIWYVEKRRRGWLKPSPVSEAVNAMDIHWQMSVTASGGLYFASEGDIYGSPFIDGQHATPEKLEAPINSDFREGTPFIALDESYLIFGSSRPNDSQGMDDLYVSFGLADGSWSDVVNLGPEVNSDAQELYPTVSPDGNYLFFLSSKSGTYDVYWIDAQIIDQLKPKSE
jgi:hypothetical protein